MAKHDFASMICAVLGDAGADWTLGDDPGAIAGFLAAGQYHGMLPLLDAAFHRRAERETWPKEILAACRKAARLGAMIELAERVEIVRVLDGLASAGVSPLLLKGFALAYSHYPSAPLRPRADSDLLIPRDRRAKTDLALEQLGYVRQTAVEGEYISSQSTWSRLQALGVTHALDIHWRISNSPILARTLNFGELAAAAVAVPALGGHARALAPVHALLFACIHRAGHANAPYYVDGVAHLGGDRLIWLYDIHLLVASMSAEELDTFSALAASRKVTGISAEALQRTRECFATPVAARLIDVLDVRGPVELSARYLSGGRTRQMMGEFLALDRWSDRGGWMRELAFPSAAYMRSKYSGAAGTWLPILYARRAMNGIARFLISRDAHDGR